MRAVVNFSNGSYLPKQQRLIESMSRYNIPVFAYSDYAEIGSPTHQQDPYGFKLHAIQHAINKGATSILYCDSSIWAIKDPTALFDIIEKDGYLMQEAGHYVGTWSNDECLAYFGITRAEAMQMPMYGNAGLLGLSFLKNDDKRNFNKWGGQLVYVKNEEKWGSIWKPTVGHHGRGGLVPISEVFFRLWFDSLRAGSFRGTWDNHRHDMTCGSIIANQLGMKYQKGDEILAYAGPDDPVSDKIILKAQG